MSVTITHDVIAALEYDATAWLDQAQSYRHTSESYSRRVAALARENVRRLASAELEALECTIKADYYERLAALQREAVGTHIAAGVVPQRRIVRPTLDYSDFKVAHPLYARWKELAAVVV